MQLFTTRGSVPPAAGSADEDCAASLLRTIEAEIIPRLMLAHGAAPNEALPGVPVTAASGEDQAAELAEIILRRDVVAARVYVQARRRAGMTVEALFLDLLAPVARRLGTMWEADECDFTQVTVGLWRLQQIVHEHSAVFLREGPAALAGRRALLIAAPGSQHTLGLLMVGEFFRRGGWEVEGDPTLSLAAACGRVAGVRFDLVGLSVGSECHIPGVRSAILALRQASLNPSVLVMVGGPIVGFRKDFVERVGADATSPDAASAVALADRLVKERVAASP